MRRTQTEVDDLLDELEIFKKQMQIRTWDLKGRRITNLGRSKEIHDAINREEFLEFQKMVLSKLAKLEAMIRR